jgi:hypothetical protein
MRDAWARDAETSADNIAGQNLQDFEQGDAAGAHHDPRIARSARATTPGDAPFRASFEADRRGLGSL